MEESDDIEDVAISKDAKPPKKMVTPIYYAKAHFPNPMLQQERKVAYDYIKKMVLVPWRDVAGMEKGWSQVPPAAFMGFTTVASRASENTGDHYPNAANNKFHEMGLFQTPGGPSSGPAPSQDPNAANNAWTRLAPSPYVRDMLGNRDGITTPEAWRTAIKDQCAIGLADLRANMRGISSRLGAAGVKDPSSTWAVALSFMGFSQGVTPIVNKIKRFINELAAVPERQRFSKLGDLIEKYENINTNFAKRAMYLNAMRKLESGRMYAWKQSDAEGKAYDAWYDRPRIDPDVWVATRNVQNGFSATTGGARPGASLASASTSGGGGLLMIAAIAAGAYMLLRGK